MRRHWACLSIFVALMAALVVPSLALAKTTTFQIRNARGRVCGSVSLHDYATGRVMNSQGRKVGFLLEGVHPACTVWHAPSADGPDCAWAYQNVLHPSHRSPSSQAVIGRAVRGHGRWLLQQRVNGS